MEKAEKRWLILLVVVAVTFNALTLSPLIPWQQWNLWSSPVPDRTYRIGFEDYDIKLPAGGIDFQAGEFVEFIATSQDVTYGFGVFRSDGTIVFQMQVLPGRENSFIWKFTEPGLYDVRSTEYSGPRHPEMFIEDAIRVRP